MLMFRLDLLFRSSRKVVPNINSPICQTVTFSFQSSSLIDGCFKSGVNSNDNGNVTHSRKIKFDRLLSP